MARCALNISHPKFVKLMQAAISGDPTLNEGLKTLCEHIVKDRKLCNWVNHPMPGYPKYQNRIWKWDFNPDSSSHSATRKGWRLYAYVPDPQALDPIPAVAFFCYDKADEPGGNPATWIVRVLKKFLAEESKPPSDGDVRFRRQLQPDGMTRSLCLTCFETVSVSQVDAEVEAGELRHQCIRSQ